MLALTTVLAAAALFAQAAKPEAQTAPPPGVELRYSTRPETPTVGDPITIDFDWTLPEKYQVRFPQVGNELGDFTILEVHPGPTIPEAPSEKSSGDGKQNEGAPSGGKVHYRARIVAALYKVGEFELPSIAAVIRDMQGTEHAVSTPLIKVRIQSVLGEKDQKLKDLKRQAEIQEPVRWILWLTLALFGALLAALGWWWWSRRRARAEVGAPTQFELDPLDLAEADLRDLLGRGLLEKGLVKQFYVSLSDIIKKILEAGYSVQTFEKTSSEIMASLRNGSRAAGAPEIERIESLLINCDLVKFAKYIPPKAEIETVLKSTMDLLESCRKLREPPPEQPPPVIVETN